MVADRDLGELSVEGEAPRALCKHPCIYFRVNGSKPALAVLIILAVVIIELTSCLLLYVYHFYSYILCIF